MKISEYIVSCLKEKGIKYVFGVQGSGTAIQMFDALGEADGIEYVCTLHEQAAGMAADAYSSANGTIGACVATCGPGASNLSTCIAGSFYNSNPVLYIIGQPQTNLYRSCDKLRHYGYHENNLDMFRPICKYVAEITDPDYARYEIEKALYIANEGRKGPTIVALPDNITWLDVDPEKQDGFIPDTILPPKEKITSGIKKTVELLSAAKRPVIIAGKGIRCAGAISCFRELSEKVNVPVLLTWGAKDILSAENRHNIGVFGIQGTRYGNFTVQNADVILAVGTRLDPSETGIPQKLFARDAQIISVDVDNAELEKYDHYGINVKIRINADAKDFILGLLNEIENTGRWNAADEWWQRIQDWKKNYPICLKEYYLETEVNPYVFIRELGLEMRENDVIVSDTSNPRNFLFQSFENKNGQRMITWFNYSCLGYGLPGSLGAYFAVQRRVVALMGDGGLQFNIQELATIKYHNADIKIFVFDNEGFGNIYHVQNNYVKGRHHGIDKKHGLPLPDIKSIVEAYGIPVVCVNSNKEIKGKIQETLGYSGPVFCLVKIPIYHWVVPRKTGGDPIEDMIPKLDREEFNAQMLIPPV